MAVSARDDAPQNHSQDEAAAHGETKKKNSLVRGIVEFVIIVVIALALATGIRTFVIQPFFVPSGSMKQTLQINDRVVASKITTSISGVGRGEIMVFKDPGNWLPVMQPADDGWRSVMAKALTFVGLLPSDSGDDLVKRVIGIDGDRVACCNEAGQIVLVDITEGPSRNSPPTGRISEVLGDHLDPGLEIEVSIRNYGIPHQWDIVEVLVMTCK